MKNYREPYNPIVCSNCINCFVLQEHDDMNDYFCTDETKPRPPCGSVFLGECSCHHTNMDYTIEEIERDSYEVWDKWANENRVSPQGMCDHFEGASI